MEMHNEFHVGYLDLVAGFRPTAKQPLILVSVPGTSGTPAVLQSGTHEIATGQRTASRTADFSDNFSISAGAHRITFGLSTQLFGLDAFQLRGSYGVWEFASLDSLQAGTVSRYRVTRDTGSVTAASGALHDVHVGDEWQASSRLSITLGLRADAAVLSARPPYVAAVDSTFHLRSDEVPSGNIQWSPRLGFNYRLTNNGEAPLSCAAASDCSPGVHRCSGCSAGSRRTDSRCERSSVDRSRATPARPQAFAPIIEILHRRAPAARHLEPRPAARST